MFARHRILDEVIDDLTCSFPVKVFISLQRIGDSKFSPQVQDTHSQWHE